MVLAGMGGSIGLGKIIESGATLEALIKETES